jgi:hypothetical protein
LFLSQVLAAQTAPHPAFRQYTTDDGLASSETYCILQDNEGYIWISTDNGVSRFDGYGFKNYGLNEGLKENVIFVLQLDTLGRVWMQAQSGNLYYLEQDTILPYWNNAVIQNIKNRPDWSMGFVVVGAGDTVHLSSLAGGINSITRDGHFSTLPADMDEGDQFFEKKGTVLHGTTWNSTSHRTQVDKLDRNVQIITPTVTWNFTGLKLTDRKGQAPSAFRLADGQYLYKVYDDLWYIENGVIQWYRYFPYIILHAQKMRNGKLFLGLHHYQGLRVYPSKEALFQDNSTTWLQGQSVSYFMEDRQGGQWFATNENGVFYAPAEAFEVYDKESGLPDNRVTAISISNKNQLFAGLGNGEIWELEPEAGKLDQLPPSPGSGSIRDLIFVGDQLWAGHGGLFVYSEGVWDQAREVENGNVFSMGNRITASPSENRIWSCDHNGFMNYEPGDPKPIVLLRGYGQRTYVVREDFNGRVWVGRPAGLFEWKNDSLQSRQNLHPAFTLRVEDIALLPDSSLAIATKGGGLVFWKNGRTEQLTTNEGLSADMMENVYAAPDGTVWAGTLNGLNRITGTWGQRQVKRITVFNGLPSNEINRVATVGNELWVATSKGLVHFLPKEKNHYAPVPEIDVVLVNNRPINHSKRLSLGPNQNNLTIRFSAINYSMNGKIPYRYRFTGSPWTTTLTRSVNLPVLPAGERRFEVQAQNEDGIWSESAVLRFEIQPHWYATWWARSAAAVALALGVFMFLKIRTKRLEKAHEMQLQMANLERSALQAQMNPHFIFNCLNSIQNFILQNEKESAISYLGSFAALVRSMLNASVSGSIALADEIKLLNNYLALEKLRFKGRFDFEVTVAEGIDVYEVKIPPLLIQPYVENAVLHGMSNKEAEGKVAVHFEKKTSFMEITVEDNGPGMSKENVHKYPGPAHKSVGMSITKKRLELLAKNRQNSEVRIEPGSASGTVVHIRIELEESH